MTSFRSRSGSQPNPPPWSTPPIHSGSPFGSWVFGQTGGASNNPFGASSSGFGGSSKFGKEPTFGGFGSTPSQSSPFGSTFQQTQPSFGFNIFGSSTPFGASSQPAFGATTTPALGSTSTPAFGDTSTLAFGATSTPAFGASSMPAFGSSTAALGASSPSFGSTSIPAFGTTSTDGDLHPQQVMKAYHHRRHRHHPKDPTSSRNMPAFGSSAALGASSPSFGSTSIPAFGTTSTGGDLHPQQVMKAYHHRRCRHHPIDPTSSKN